MLSHASIRSSNLERSVQFYQSLGFGVLGRVENKKNNAEIVLMQDPKGKGAVLEIIHYSGETNGFQRKGLTTQIVVRLLYLAKHIQVLVRTRLLNQQLDGTFFDHIGFQVDNLNETLTALRAQDSFILKPFKVTPTSTVTFIEDPDGIIVELNEEKG